MDSGEIGMFGRFARAMLSAVLAIGVALPAMPQVAFADDRGSAAAVAPEEAGISLAASSQSDGTMPSPAAEGDASAAVPVIEDSTQARVGFVYIDAPALFVGGTQDVVVALDETEAVVQSAELFYVDTAGVQKSVAANKFAGNAALFEISVGEAGDYEVRSMAATLADGSVVVLDLYDEERAAYPGFIAVSAAADPFSIDDEGLEGAALTFSLDGDGGLVAGKSLPDVIGSAALQARGSSNLLSSDDGTLVIVLDAGHGGSDPGAVANGLLEKDLTLSIARYCKEALEQYANVKVYMTRSSDFYVGLKERVDYAVSVGADAFVGIHINSAGTSGANGAEVWYPNASSWYYEAHVEGQQLAESILEKLTELGLYDRGVKVRDSDDELNPDGSVADYYATIRYARQVGMPSIIVEHAFITGDGDSQKLAQDSWLKAMGEADAEGIAQAYGLSKGQWVFEDGVWHWYEGSTMVTNAWRNIDGMRHWFGPDGVAVRGWHDIDGSRYYFDPATANLYRGWLDEGGKRYRLDRDDGHLWTGWYTVDGVWYCSDGDGVLRKGWYDEGGKRYRLDRDDGHLWTGGFTVDGVWYHALPDGEVYSGWIDGSDGGRYYYDPAKGGALALGWFAVDGGRYYASPDGSLVRGWLDEGGKRYRLDRDDGHLWTGWYTVDGVWYYSDENGVLNGGWQLSGIYYYYYNSNGELVPSKTQELYYVARDRAVSPEKMVDAFQMSGAVYPSADLAKGGAPTIDDFCRILYEEATAEGIRPQVVFCQAMLETGWLRFGGDVSIGQFNFAGLGAVGGGASGASFPDVRTGIRAQVQHLKAYANSEPLVKECVDPRFSYVQRGVSEYVQWLGIPNNPQGKGWAASDGYGMNIVEMIMRYGLW